jgi:hypothetical protein
MGVRFTVIAVVIAALIALPSLAAGEDVTQGLQIAQQAAFPVYSSPQTPSFGCTAFYLAPALVTDREITSVVVTAGHCFIEGQTYYRKDVNGKWHKMIPVSATESFGYDSGIALTSDDVGNAPGYVGPTRTDLQEGETVVSYGFPAGFPRATTGTFLGWGEAALVRDPDGTSHLELRSCASKSRTNCFLLVKADEPTIGGQSGSPVLDAQGRLVGIVVYRLSISGDLMGVTPISHVSLNYGAAPVGGKN